MTIEEYDKLIKSLKFIGHAQITYNPTAFIMEYLDDGKYRFFLDYRGYKNRYDVDELDETDIYKYGSPEYFQRSNFILTEKSSLSNRCANWIKEYFKTTGGKTAMIGISGGKDSTVVAALCAKALGPENVIGVMMPNGVQTDIADSRRVCEFLKIRSQTVDISSTYNTLKQSIYNADPSLEKLSEQCLINLAPRIRMTCLYGIAQNNNGRVAGTGNLSERILGYSTLWGDSACDFNPIGNFLVSEVLKIGDELGLPYDLVHKAPADGLTGMTDEEKLGFTYDDFENFHLHGGADLPCEVFEKIQKRVENNKWKMNMINVPIYLP